MVLRKPYAFLIKHFKFMHLVLTVCMIYLIYRTELMISFLNEYINSITTVIGQPITSTLYTIGVVLLPILILVFSVVLLVIMTIKEKPRMYYILMIVVHVIIIAAYFYGYTVFSSMEKTILEIKTIKALRDILMYCILLQGAFSVVSLIRGVGFDIKKFDFVSDLQSLEISEEDSEEFEIDIDFDLNDKTRKGKRILRFLKYKYKEHKLIAHLMMGVVFAFLLFYVYSHFNIYYKTSPEGTNFNMNGYTLGVEKSYLLSEGMNGTSLGEKGTYLVAVDLNIKSNYANPQSFSPGTVELKIGDDIYRHTDQYESYLLDLGTTYKSQKVSTEFVHYLLVYEIPASKINDKFKLGFTNASTGETAYVRLNPKKLKASDAKIKEYALGDTVDFSESTLGSTTLKIQSYEIRNKFVINYRYCSDRMGHCVDSEELLMPNQYTSSYDKTVLKLELELQFDKKYASSNLKDFYGLLKGFGTIEYEIGGQQKKQEVYLGEIKSKRAPANTYYIEIYDEIKAADSIALVFQIRNHVYKYYIK